MRVTNEKNGTCGKLLPEEDESVNGEESDDLD